jgi:type IV secretion system protein TrbI
VQHPETNPSVPPLRDIDAPRGLDLYPDPPETVRVSKRAGMIVLSILCGLATVFGYGMYQRQSTGLNSSLASDDAKMVGPATTAAREITRDIPEGVIKLLDASARKQSSRGRPGADGPGPEAKGSTARSERSIGPAQPITSSQNTYTQPSPEERRLAQAYERELQAMTAPTGARSGGGGPSTLGLPAPALQSAAAGADASSLAALAQALTGKAGTDSSEAHRNTNREFDDQNMQARKELFLAQARSSTRESYLKSTRIAPISEYEIKAGWEIPAVLEQELNSDLPGELKALVTANVYDTATGRHLLIPQGARMVGAYDSNIAYGQSGVQVVWHRIIYPDASSIDLGGMVGQAAQGSSGFRSEVDNHYKRLVGFTVLSSLFSAGFQLSQTQNRSVLQNPSVGEIAAGAVGQEVSQTGAQITRRNLNIQPTIKIPVGYRFNVRVNRDILFDSPYEPRRSPGR